MLMYLDSKNEYKSCPIMDRDGGFRKTRDYRDMSNNSLISSYYLKLVCDFKPVLKFDCYSEEE